MKNLNGLFKFMALEELLQNLFGEMIDFVCMNSLWSSVGKHSLSEDSRR